MKKKYFLLGLAIFSVFFFRMDTASAHCDTLSGPVVTAGQRALESGNPAPALVWVKPEDEEKIKKAFNKARAARKDGSNKQKADREFFETLVRVHREGEGAAYEGLKPADTDLGPIVPLADKAYETGSYTELAEALKKEIDLTVAHRVAEARELKAAAGDDVPKGREAIEAYVSLVHWSEGLHGMIEGHADTHQTEAHTETTHTGEAHESWWHRMWHRLVG